MRRGFHWSLWAATAAFLMSVTPAHARWYKAETDRFIIYGEARESAVREFALKLSAYDAALRQLNSLQSQPPGQKLEIYLLRDHRQARRILPGGLLYEWYSATPDRVYAVVSRWQDSSATDFSLFHEYAHHFMYENFPAAYPAWFVEGWADYFAAADVATDKVKIGAAVPVYPIWLLYQRWLPMEEVLGSSIGEVREDKRVLFFAQAWLLMHYMRSTPERAQQLNVAIGEIARGEDPVKAFQAASGLSMEELTRELKGYQQLPVFSIQSPLPGRSAITVTELPETAEAFIYDDLRMVALEPDDFDDDYLQDLRSRAARYSDDCHVQRILARAEFAIGDVPTAERLVTRCLGLAPNDVENLKVAGFGQLRAGERSPADKVSRFRAARAFFNKAYELDQSDYRILYGYAVSRTVEPAFPNENDVTAILAAWRLAPQVAKVSMLAGEAMIARGKGDEGRRLLAYVANNPHGGPLAAKARALMEGQTRQEAEAAAARAVRQAAGEKAKPGSAILDSQP